MSDTVYAVHYLKSQGSFDGKQNWTSEQQNKLREAIFFPLTPASCIEQQTGFAKTTTFIVSKMNLVQKFLIQVYKSFML